MSQLVGNNTGDFIAAQGLQQARGHGYRRMLGVTAGREGVGLRVGDQIDLGSGQLRPLGQIVDEAVDLRRFLRRDRFCAVHRKHHLIAVPIGEKIGNDRKAQRQKNAGLPTKQIADGQKQAGQGGKQKSGAHYVHRNTPWPYIGRDLYDDEHRFVQPD